MSPSRALFSPFGAFFWQLKTPRSVCTLYAPLSPRIQANTLNWKSLFQQDDCSTSHKKISGIADSLRDHMEDDDFYVRY